MNYSEFIASKSQLGTDDGFKAKWIPDGSFDFQSSLIEWSCRRGKDALLADTGLGKTRMQLAWAENLVRETNKPVLILTPLAVSFQSVREANAIGLDAKRTKNGKVHAGINITNFQQAHKYDWKDFSGVVCDDASIMKNFEGSMKAMITEFMRRIKYRLLCTATPAPNDYIELGTLSEALGELGYMDMLGMFFKNDQNSLHPTSGRGRFERGVDMSQNKWRFKRHAEASFWRWVCSWARAVRKPSDVDPSFSDTQYVLPPLEEIETIVKRNKPLDGMLLTLPAVGLKEQRQESRQTIAERCEVVAKKIKARKDFAVAWCHLNDEGDLLAELLPNAVQISGRDSDDQKEEKFEAFTTGKVQQLIVKPKIAAHGLNWQHCNYMTFFPSHSFEQYYQLSRRCYRYGQKRPVTIEIVSTEGEAGVLRNIQRKGMAARHMFDELIKAMHQELTIGRTQTEFNNTQEIPTWLKS